MKSALICIDFINEIVSQEGKLAGKGYHDFVRAHDTLSRVAKAQRHFRAAGELVVHVRLAFSLNYAEHSDRSVLLGKAREFGILQVGKWGTEFPANVAPLESDVILTKHRISAFFGTSLDAILRARGIEQVYIAGVATDLAVQSAARDAHDRDYGVTVLSDCCAATSDTDHDSSLTTLRKIASVSILSEL